MEKNNISPTPITSSKQTALWVVFCLKLQRKGVGAAARHMRVEMAKHPLLWGLSGSIPHFIMKNMYRWFQVAGKEAYEPTAPASRHRAHPKRFYHEVWHPAPKRPRTGTKVRDCVWARIPGCKRVARPCWILAYLADMGVLRGAPGRVVPHGKAAAARRK